MATLELPSPPPPPPPPAPVVKSPSETVKPLKPTDNAVIQKTVAPLKSTIDPPVSKPRKVTALKPTPKMRPQRAPSDVKPLKPTAPSRAERPRSPRPPVSERKPETPQMVAKDHTAAPEEPAAKKTPPTVGRTEASPLVAAGRPLLRLLEHGDGPRIDIAWPTDPRERSALFNTFERCYGMVVALVAENGDLYSDRSTVAPWQINLDYYSGFVRQSGTLSTARERDWSRNIVRRHPTAAGKHPVRVFPRQTDALLMGGLHKLLDGSYRSTKSISARYARVGQTVMIVDVSADGLTIPGRIDLSAAARRRCQSDNSQLGRHS